MGCKSIVQRRFIQRMLVAAFFSLVFSAVASLAIRFGHVQAALAYLVATLPAFPVMGGLVVTGLYLAEETDEFQRHLMVQSLLGGIGITLSATTVYGYLEALAHVPPIQMTWVYPMFWIATVATVPFVWMRYR